ncbi:CbtA family protein [Arthrobacter sp. NPDC093139]|uniref:CbtA family protein n=1 Tax=Arthrobacter sp. NPDC093139 TaxID=3363945 RepID=UPI00380A954C
MSLTLASRTVTLSLRSVLVRGLLAGLIAGFIAGGVAFWAGTGLIDQAIALENAQPEAHDHSTGSTGATVHEHTHSDEDPLIPRDVQRAGLLLATTLAGAATGVIFATVWFLKSRRSVAGQRPLGIMALAAAGWAAVVAVPWLIIPPNPPALGSPNSIDHRTALWLFAVILGVGAVSIWFVLRGWAESKAAQPSVFSKALPALAAIAIVLLGWRILPATSVDYSGFPADLLWNFRLAAGATQLALWMTMGIVFQFFMERASRTSVRT